MIFVIFSCCCLFRDNFIIMSWGWSYFCCHFGTIGIVLAVLGREVLIVSIIAISIIVVIINIIFVNNLDVFHYDYLFYSVIYIHVW